VPRLSRILVLGRHQLNGLAEAGFHAIAPDMRGYGQTEQPKEIEAYDIFQLTGDLVGLINALGDGAKGLESRLSETDVAPDLDGRFRVNDFFCYEDTWKSVLDRLVRDTDAVLMDRAVLLLKTRDASLRSKS